MMSQKFYRLSIAVDMTFLPQEKQQFSVIVELVGENIALIFSRHPKAKSCKTVEILAIATITKRKILVHLTVLQNI